MRGLRRIPLSVRVPFFTAGLMILVGFLASQQVLTTLRQVQNARVREMAQLQIEALSIALGPLVLRNDIWEVYDTLERAAGENGGRRLVFAVVANDKGVILAATDPARAPIDSGIDTLASGAQDLENLSLTGEDAHIRLLAPLVYQGRTVGQILTELDVSDLVVERKRAARLLLLGNAVATFLLAIVGYLAMRRILAPVENVMGRMRNFPQTPEPVPESEMPRGDSEVAQLAQSYNTMVGAIEAKAEADKRLAERERFVSLGRLSSSLAHEINNPLGGLLNAADTMREYADRPEVVRESADILVRGLEHLRDVARVTLDQNRLDRSGARLGVDDFDDLRLLISAETSRQHQNLDWTVEVSGRNLGAFPSAPVRQIALNLLLNASEAAGANGRIAFRATDGEGGLCIEVSDSGSGLSKAACERLLGSGPVAPGGGVGLRLVHDLVRALDGYISLKRDGGMTRICIDLPYPAVEDA